MDNIKIFTHDKFGEIKTTIINNEPYFIARDVATVLGYAILHKAVQTHCRHCSKMEHW